MSKKKDIGSFGDPSYLVKKFDDISKAVYSTRSAAAKAITELVKSKSTKKDNLYVYSVLKALVVGFFSYIVDKTGFGSSKLVRFMYELMKANRDNYQDDNESARDTIKVLKYAFSW